MDGYLTIGTDIDTRDFDKEIAYIENEMDEIKTVLEAEKIKPRLDNKDVLKMEKDYEKLGRTLTKLKKKQADVILTDNGGSWGTIEGKISSIGNGLSKTIGKMGKWALGIWAVESAYGAVRRIISNIQSSDDQIATNIDYMTFVVSNSLKPVVEWIVNGVYQLLVYVNMISKAWFGLDMFAGSTEKYLEKSNKDAKELKKSLTSFDTANVLQSNEKNDSSITTPSFDVQTPVDAPVPAWLQWIIDNKELVIGGLLGIAGALTAIKLGLDLIQGVGLIILIEGIILLIKDVIEFLKDPTWEGFGKILVDIGVILLGLALLIGSFPIAIAAAVAIIVGLIITNWDKIWSFLCLCGDFIYKYVIKPVVDWFKFMGEQLWKLIKEPIDNIKRFIGGITDCVKDVWNGIQKILNGDIKGGLELIFKGIVNIIITAINFLIDALNTAIAPVRLLVVAVGKVMGKNWSMDNIKVPKIKYLKFGGIVDVPKTGYPIASNVRAGEAGPEAVIPLNDETMQRLAKYISRFINIDINLTNKLDSRVLLRVLKQIQGEQNFAKNGG